MKTHLLSLALATFALGCAADVADLKGDATGVNADELRLASNQVLEVGRVELGGRRAVRHPGSPRYRALRFRADAGERVEVRVRTNSGLDAMAWLTDDRRTVIASNDDSDGTLDARLATALPGAGSREWLVVFREYDGRADTFSVSVDRLDYAACARTIECIAVPAGGCCNPLRRTAINARYQSLYAESSVCRPPYPPCAPPPDLEIPADTRTAACNATEHRCELVEPACDRTPTATRRYFGDPETCQRIRFACDAGETYFADACGCGCERAAR